MTNSRASSDRHYMEEKMMFPCPEHTKQNLQRFYTIIAITILLTFSLFSISCKLTQKDFASPDEAVKSLVTTLKAGDERELAAIFGPESKELLDSGDSVYDQQIRQKFLQAYEKKNHIDPDGDRFLLVIGENDWPFPIPLAAKGDRWIFDSASGKEEIINRRIGRNELNTIQVLLAIVDAQREYAMQDRDQDTFMEYARKFASEPGKKDGLYWEAEAGEEESPLGELIANARAKGYDAVDKQEGTEPYQGYFYRILTSQGSNAPGGAYDYIVKDRMIGGFAVVAYPADYGNSGVMTFIVNHEGVVFQKDLGENTEDLAKAMQSYDPDSTWTKAEPVKPERSIAPSSVLDKTWQWQGTITPVEKITAAQPERYTILLTGEGRLQADFDCNKGGGDFQISEGSLSFGPMISTRMACPSDTQDMVFMRDLQRVQSFFVENGMLYLELPYDSGTMSFRQAP